MRSGGDVTGARTHRVEPPAAGSRTLLRFNKQHTGQTIADDIQDARIEVAIGLLEEGRPVIRTIATEVG